jgi:hypothetical protein
VLRKDPGYGARLHPAAYAARLACDDGMKDSLRNFLGAVFGALGAAAGAAPT